MHTHGTWKVGHGDGISGSRVSWTPYLDLAPDAESFLTVPVRVGKEAVCWFIGYEPPTELADLEDDAALTAAAVNSYARHCKDPIAAAESDVLGEAIKLLAEIERQGWVVKNSQEIIALLARVRGEE